MSDLRIFVSFDVERDRDLFDRLVAESDAPGLGFQVSGGSEAYGETGAWSERARRGIRHAQRMIVICGEHTDACQGVAAELRIAREEKKPYLLLWGRRERMCTKPVGAKPTDGMYGWTTPTLQEQFAQMSRALHREETASDMKRARQGSHPTSA